VDADAGCSCKLGPDCRQPGKHPRTPSGHHTATTNPDQVRAWWTRWPNANIGITTGTTGLAVVDLDGPEGLDTWQRLTARYGPGPDTAAAITPHGQHRWHSIPRLERRGERGQPVRLLMDDVNEQAGDDTSSRGFGIAHGSGW
jgi:hypothetical protein